MYSALLLDHFEHPRNHGEIENADASVRIENPACGDIVELSMRVTEGRIEEIRFRAKGCVPVIACGSVVTELAMGRTLAEARVISKAMIESEIGGVPEASGHASQLVADALRTLLARAMPNA